MIRTAVVTICLLGSLLAGTASAGAREALDTFTRDLRGLDGQFSQQVYDAQNRVRETSSGRVALSAPRLFRWEYVTPYEQLIVADGRKVWVYDPDLEQVTVREQGDAEQNNPLAILIDPAMLDRDFNVVEAVERNGLSWLEISPINEEQAGFETARLGFDGSTLSRIEILDVLGQRTEITLTALRRNPPLDRDTFQYSPPAGVDVVGDI